MLEKNGDSPHGEERRRNRVVAVRSAENLGVGRRTREDEQQQRLSEELDKLRHVLLRLLREVAATDHLKDPQKVVVVILADDHAVVDPEAFEVLTFQSLKST